MSYKEKYGLWLGSESVDAETKDELRALDGNEKEIEDRFYRDLEFGTAGLRGVIGAGTNRMNRYTVGKATQGLADFIATQGGEAMKRGVVIAYDSRHMSPEFADFAALTLAANGVKAYVFEKLRPVPELSFAVRHLRAVAGIAITASHNPPEYNGYKVYWEDGAQVSAPYDKQIMDSVNSITDLAAVKFADKESAVKAGLYEVIGKDIDEEYYKNVLAQIQDKEALRENAKGFKVVYSPLHGTGNVPVREVLKRAGFENVFIVSEQELPNGDFPTVGYPNPENQGVFEMGIALAERHDADVVVATDPDADRVGAVVKNEKGEYIILSGNMSGTLLTHFILDSKKKKGTLPVNAAVIKTIVSTEMVNPICAEYGAEIVDVLTGFKFIGGKMKEYEQTGEKTYIFGFEESYGCLAGTYARDKDAVVATLLLCELGASLKAQGKTLYEGLLALYDKYGYYKESVFSLDFKGVTGAKEMKELMGRLRETPPAEFGGIGVLSVSDYLKQVKTLVKTKVEEPLTLPKSDVLKFGLEDGSWVCVRPSGTEPKIKFYAGVKSDSAEGAQEKVKLVFGDVDKLVGE